MGKLLLNILVGFSGLAAIYVGLVIYGLKAAPRMNWDSKIVLNEFYVRSRVGDYGQAHQLLSRNLKSSVSVKSLGQQWKAFERAHGPIKNWAPARGGTVGGGTINLWPRSVDFTHKVTGQKSGAGKVKVRMVPEGGTWRVGKLSIQP